jgi:hypothetical protein
MSKRKTDHETGGICSRRAFLAATGAAAAGLAAGSLAKPGRLFAAAPSKPVSSTCSRPWAASVT